MFNVEAYKKAYKNFIDYLNGYSNSLLVKIGECDRNISLSEAVDEIKKSHDVNSILNNREFIVSLNPVVLNYYKIIEFFKENEALDADQVTDAINRILDIDEIKNFEGIKKNIYENKSSYETLISRIKAVIDGNLEDIDFVNKMILESTLSEKDKLLILSGLAYESTITYEVKKDRENNKESSIKEDKSKKDKFKKLDNLLDVTPLITKYKELSKRVSTYKKELYSYWKDKTSRQLQYAFSLAKLYNSGELERKDIFNNTLNERMLILLLSCKEYEDLINMSLKGVTDNKLAKSEYDELSYYINALEENVTILDKYDATKKVKDSDIDVTYENPKVLFLLDKDNNGIIDYSSFTLEDIDKINSLIDKCERKGKNEKSILLHKVKDVDFDVLVGKTSKIICPYVVLSDGSILILNIATKNKGYDETIGILAGYKDKIKAIRSESTINNLDSLYEEQEEYRNQIRDNYGVNVSKAEEVKLWN
mgnify:FL=1